MGGVTATRDTGNIKLANKTLRQVSWTELNKHDTADSAWIAIDGQVYDVTAFSKYILSFLF